MGGVVIEPDIPVHDTPGPETAQELTPVALHVIVVVLPEWTLLWAATIESTGLITVTVTELEPPLEQLTV